MSYAILRWAIEGHRSLTGIYDNYVRYFSPHMLGSNANGNPIVICFQYGGGRPDRILTPEGEWCHFAVDRLRRLETNRDKWVAGPPENKPSHLLIRIDLDGD